MAAAHRCDIEDSGFSAGRQDFVGVVPGIASGSLGARGLREHVVADVVREVQLACEDDVVDVDHDVDVHGAAGIPAGIDRSELDVARRVGALLTAQEGLVGQVLDS